MNARIALASLIAVAGMAAPPALARAPEPSAVTIDNYHAKDEALHFPGHVESSRKCEKNRKVIIHTTGPGAEGKIGSDKTNSKGKFRVTHPIPLPGEEAYAEVKRSTVGDMKCGRDESPPISLAG